MPTVRSYFGITVYQNKVYALEVGTALGTLPEQQRCAIPKQTREKTRVLCEHQCKPRNQT